MASDLTKSRLNARMRFLVVALAIGVLAISSARAQAPDVHPDFTGVWVMDTTKTQPGPMTPAGLTYTIEQRRDTLKIKRESKSSRGDFTANLVYGMDGKPWKNSVTQAGMQIEVSSILTWEGATLIITSTLNAGGQEIRQVEKWSLDPSGQSLVADRNVESMGQQYSMKLLLTKRP